MEYLSTTLTIFWVFVGIIISLLLPIVVNILRRSTLESGENILVNAWKKYSGNKYVQIFLAATAVAIIIVFLFDMKFTAARDAALAGFAWESFVNKLSRYPG